MCHYAFELSQIRAPENCCRIKTRKYDGERIGRRQSAIEATAGPEMRDAGSIADQRTEDCALEAGWSQLGRERTASRHGEWERGDRLD